MFIYSNMSVDAIDIQEIVRNWAMDFPLNQSIQRDAVEIQPEYIEWSHLRIHHAPVEYFEQVQRPAPNTHALSTCYFTNKTDSEQTFIMKTESRTRSVCQILMSKTFIIGQEVNIKMAAPKHIIEAKAGVKGKRTVNNSNVETFEEDLVWSVNSGVVVHPKYKTL